MKPQMEFATSGSHSRSWRSTDGAEQFVGEANWVSAKRRVAGNGQGPDA
jgi:hypothetical protein